MAGGWPGPVPLAELPLEHLPGRRARQLVDELDRARQLVAGEPLTRERDQLSALDDGAGTADDERLDRLAPALVRNPDHRDVEHVGCCESASSTSIGYTFSPPETIMSLIRSVRNR